MGNQIIPFENLESIPVYASRDYNYQVCKYETGKLPIIEETEFPSFRQIMNAALLHKSSPEIDLSYNISLGMNEVEDDTLFSKPEKAIRVDHNPEPYYNKDKNIYEFSYYAVFSEIESAYEFAIQ